MFLAAFRLHTLIIIYIIMLLFITWPYNFRTSRRRRMDLGVLIDVRWGIDSHLPSLVVCSAAHLGTRRSISATDCFVAAAMNLFCFCSSQTRINLQLALYLFCISHFLRGGGSLFKEKELEHARDHGMKINIYSVCCFEFGQV